MKEQGTNIAQKRRFVNFTMTDAEIAHLDEVAERNGRTRSGEARFALRNHIAAEQAAEASEAVKEAA